MDLAFVENMSLFFLTLKQFYGVWTFSVVLHCRIISVYFWYKLMISILVSRPVGLIQLDIGEVLCRYGRLSRVSCFFNVVLGVC